jgi:formate-dependent nitrite reductase membrane component NrfD
VSRPGAGATGTAPERPVIKEPVWTWEIPCYFFTGGLGGASAVLAYGARLAGNDELERSAWAGALAGLAASPPLLISDLGRPSRFLNMLRVVKVTSPMSVGTLIFSAESATTGIAAGCRLFDVLPRVRAIAQVLAGLIGPAQATYTGALVAQSVVPAWHGARRELPVLFASSAAASAGGAAAILTPTEHAGPARRLGIIGGVAELATTKLMEKRLGKLVGSVYHEGKAGTYSRLGTASTAAGAALMALAGRRRAGAVAAGALLLSGSLCMRFAVYHAGRQSARNPDHTSIPQKERGGRAVTRTGTPASSQ